METSLTIDVTTLDLAHRNALEDVIGAQLKPNQRLIIRVTDVEAVNSQDTSRPPQTLNDLPNIYQGLTAEEIEDLDKRIKTRADLSRNAEEIEATEDRRPSQSLDDWTSLYKGLTDEEIEAIDRDINTRANLTGYLP